MTSAFLLFSRARGTIYPYIVIQLRKRKDKLVSTTAAPSLGSHSKLSAKQRVTRLNNTAVAHLSCFLGFVVFKLNARRESEKDVDVRFQQFILMQLQKK